MTLFGVVGEYGPSVTTCPKCGDLLVDVLPPEPDSVDRQAPAVAEPEPSGPYRYVGSFRDWGPAQLARSYLVSCGYHAKLLDENIVALRWTTSQAVFGLKLVVSGVDADEAREILAEDRSVDLAAVPEAALPPSQYDRCPKCGSENVRWPTLERRCKALSMLFVWFLLIAPVAAHFQPTRCRDCRHRWFPQWDTEARHEEGRPGD